MFAALAMSWGAVGWLVIAGIVVLATVGIHPSTRLATRFLERHVPAYVLAEARAGSADPEVGLVTGPPSLIDTDDPAPGPLDPVRGS